MTIDLDSALGLPSRQGEQGTPAAYPWQRTLLECFRHGQADLALEIPTGLGKTGVMAAWLLALAEGAPLPRRLVYVVDRRVVVDQATEEAERLRGYVDTEPQLKARLGLGPDEHLPVSTLRGELADNREWLADPSRPAIVVGTVDMVGSRLLFQGYGVSRTMRPYHAALLGNDCLVVLDEAHLVPPFAALLRGVRELRSATAAASQANGAWSLPPWRVLTMSAVAGLDGSQVLRLTAADLEHPEAKRRLQAAKWLRWETLKPQQSLPAALAERAWELAAKAVQPQRVLVYCDRRTDAEETAEVLRRLAEREGTRLRCALLVGARRVWERDRVREELYELGFLGKASKPPSAPVVVVATSAGEVGIDLDADHLVCDLVPWERMIQRLGRVNRRGGREAMVRVVLAEQPARRGGRRTTGSEGWQQAVLALLERLPRGPHGVQASPAALWELSRSAVDDPQLRNMVVAASTPPPSHPPLTPAVVEAWALTSLPSHPGRPDPEPWLRGWQVDAVPQTTVVWRRWLPLDPDRWIEFWEADRLRVRQTVERFFGAAPVHLTEQLETEAERVVRWLAARWQALQNGEPEAEPGVLQSSEADKSTDSEAEASAGRGGNGQQDGQGARTPWAAEAPPAKWPVIILSWQGEVQDIRRLEEFGAARSTAERRQLVDAVRSRLVVVCADVGGLKDGLLAERERALPATADDPFEQTWALTTGFRVRLERQGQEPASDGGWKEALRLPWFANEEEEEPAEWLVVEHRVDVPDEAGTGPTTVELAEHQAHVVQAAERLADRLGLPPAYRQGLRLAAAYHDEGKRAPLWQRAFRAPTDGRVYAKTKGPVEQRLLAGYRHELGSLLHLSNLLAAGHLGLPPEVEDLVLHMVAAHHGHARPTLSTAACGDLPPSALEDVALRLAQRFARLQARWGPWGLAWWESLLRAADHEASRLEARGGGRPGGEA